MAVFDPNDLVGRTFLRTNEEDGQRFRLRIVEAIDKHHDGPLREPKHMQFRVSVNNDQCEEMMSHKEIVDAIEADQAEEEAGDRLWKFQRILGHQTVKSGDPDYKGSSINVLIEWCTGEKTYEPLTLIAQTDPVTCTIYAMENDLLDQPGWKRFARLSRRQKKLLRLANQAKLRSFRRSPKHQHGFQIPHNYAEALELDKQNGNDKWQKAVEAEMAGLDECNVFRDLGHKDKANVPNGYKRIRIHLVFACKHDGRHKARMVADGHLTDVPVESVYSGVVSLRGIRLLMFIAELNGQQTWSTDITLAYLEAKTSERVCIIAGPEFGPEREGHALIIFKALYGLRSSGKRWAQRFSDCLRDMGFTPSRAEDEIWMRKRGDHYEYIGTYVDDLLIVSSEPQAIIDILLNVYKFKLKGTGPISFHLGCDFWRDDDGTLCFAPKKYIQKMMDAYERMFGTRPTSNNVSSPLEEGDHPELDTSELLDQAGTQQYQSLIGSLQWAISLGRIDVTTAVMTLSSFCAAPRRGHLERAKRVHKHLNNFRHATIRIRTAEPDHSASPEQDFDWSYSVYGNVTEEIPHDLPEPLGKHVTLTHYFDANLHHDMLTGRSVTGILHMVNQTPIDWHSKKQPTVHTATYGSEFMAGRTCMEQVMELRDTLRYLGVPIRSKSYVFGDNKSMCDSAAFPDSKLHKRHNALSWHRVREVIAAGIAAICHIPGEHNPADILSKHWGHAKIWNVLKPLLFHKGDTISIMDEPKNKSKVNVVFFMH